MSNQLLDRRFLPRVNRLASIAASAQCANRTESIE